MVVNSAAIMSGLANSSAGQSLLGGLSGSAGGSASAGSRIGNMLSNLTMNNPLSQIASSVADIGLNNYFSRKSEKRARERQLDDIAMQTYLNQYNWDKYNSPKAQMKAYKEAGLNPNLIYGQHTGGVSSSVPQADYGNGSNYNVFGQALNMYNNKKAREEELALRERQIDRMERRDEADAQLLEGKVKQQQLNRLLTSAKLNAIVNGGSPKKGKDKNKNNYDYVDAFGDITAGVLNEIASGKALWSSLWKVGKKVGAKYFNKSVKPNIVNDIKNNYDYKFTKGERDFGQYWKPDSDMNKNSW